MDRIKKSPLRGPWNAVKACFRPTGSTPSNRRGELETADGVATGRPAAPQVQAPTHAVRPPSPQSSRRGDASGSARTAPSAQAARPASPFPAGPADAYIAALARRHDPNIRQPDWQASHGGDGTAQAYAHGFWRGAVGTAATLRSGNTVTAQQVLGALATHRQLLAIDADAQDAQLFGRPLEDGTSIDTPISAKYERFPEAAALKAAMETWYEARSHEQPYELPPHVKEDDSIFAWVVEASTHDGRREPLLRLEVKPRLELIPDSGEMKRVLDAAWSHAEPSEVGRREIEALFQAATAPLAMHLPREERLNTACERMGRLHWWLSHQCNFHRGSAGISDMLSAAILLHHGFEHPGWAPGVSADIAALCNFDRDDFAGKYRSLMRSEPPNSDAQAL